MEFFGKLKLKKPSKNIKIVENKRVLIITYYWPPSGAIGVHRCLKFAKYLKKSGMDIVVYTAKNAQYPYLDHSNFKHIPEGITVLKKSIVEPFNLFKLLSGRRKDSVLTNPVQVRDKKQKLIDKISIWVRGNLFIPDARSFWIRPSVKYLSKYIKTNKIDAIISDGPPHTNTVIACKLSKKFNIPWLADFQDPWTQVDYYNEFMLSKFADKKHKKLEQETFKTAKKITIASPTWKKDLELIGAKNVDVIFWGFDENDFTNLFPDKKEHFIVSHAGLLGHDRNPSVFFKILNDIKKEDKNFAEKLKIYFAGPVDYAVKESLKSEGLEENTIYLGNIPRDKALQLTINSNLLLLPLNKAMNASGRIPGKLFEQMRSGIPIICFGPRGSDVENILNETDTGKSFEYDDYQNIKKYVVNIFYQKTERDFKKTIEKIQKYTVENQVNKIAGFLNEF